MSSGTREDGTREDGTREDGTREPGTREDGTRDDVYDAGLRMRKAVLGAEHVERSLEEVSDFARPVQELVTEYCWGAVWTRPGIDKRTRSMINLAMLTALNRGHELAVHVRGALTNGVTEEEIQEVLLQTAVYVGVPASLESFRVAERVINEVNGDG
ncbi:4-carboxymuconolactone decarboxylase [Streptomyces sp. HNM0575]|uniref:4-carboxymuconolactone decarboxylase n=1 Tax=Streptomyces sp. HNM0575 TaxID=2716338 RepID=UPI00145DE74D|nr:4-carboxymuconolactone decarboxylase [Streptomyces sp. HNM0575]NLU71877.1 4-carboxymuconolactone decarboxylase [Streptomyces sp. HNM0575]